MTVANIELNPDWLAIAEPCHQPAASGYITRAECLAKNDDGARRIAAPFQYQPDDIPRSRWARRPLLGYLGLGTSSGREEAT
ncbi:hypothetical protein HMPREF9946_04820 [Acetobacteraceae bacterium AT-5844]|nr:hypothetical protein HMPREF9946_04820 [Acetobacteraceae bacterium AT-5844]